MDRLITEIATVGRDMTAGESRLIREHVVARGFPAVETIAGPRLAGIEWKGKVLTGEERLPWDVVHYLRHKREWPEGTSFRRFLASIGDLVLDPATGIAVFRWQNRVWHLAFMRRSEKLRGNGGFEWVVLDYDVEAGYWTTAFQVKRLEDLTQSSLRRAGFRWLSLPASYDAR